MQQQPLQPSEMPNRETPYAQAEQKVVPTTTDSNVKVEKVEKIIEKVVVEEKKSPVVVEDPSMYQRGIIFKKFIYPYINNNLHRILKYKYSLINFDT